MFKLLGAFYALVIFVYVSCAQQYPIQEQIVPCVNNCMKNCIRNEEQHCNQCCGQSSGQSSYEPIVWNNYPIYLRPGSPLLASNVQLDGKAAIQSTQSMGSTSGDATSVPMNTACIRICMPSCTPQCIHQPVVSGVSEGLSSVMSDDPAPVITQGLAPVVSQEPVSVIPPQSVVGESASIFADEYKPVMSQKPEPMLLPVTDLTTPSQDVQRLPQFPGAVSQASECIPACTPTCSVPCNRQNIGSPQSIESPITATSPPTYVPIEGSVLPAIQQPTKDCAADCIPQCDAQCIQNQPQSLSVASEPLPIQWQTTSVATQFKAATSQEPLITECLRSTIETECRCPSGFIVCVTISGSNQCCRMR